MTIASKNKSKRTESIDPELPYRSVHKIRFVSAASLYDGHDASINIMRRILQSSGAEVIHLGHNRSVKEVVDCALQEDVQGIAISSYQGGHVEYFKYMIDLLKENDAHHIKVFGGGGGVIVDTEIEELHAYGVTRIFSVEDGMKMGLQGMISHMMKACDFETGELGVPRVQQIKAKHSLSLGRAISLIENKQSKKLIISNNLLSFPETGETATINNGKTIPVLGITGTGGAGKSSLTDELVRRFLTEFSDKYIAVISIDPSKVTTGGALLGDRIRMNSVFHPNVYMRSLATRNTNRATSDAVRGAIDMCRLAGFDLIIVETSGIGQSDIEITDYADINLYVMTSEFGAPTQLEKINMLDLADFVVINKFEKRGSIDALRDVRKQLRRNKNLWDLDDSQLPVYPTIAAQFNDEGVNRLFCAFIDILNKRFSLKWITKQFNNALPVDFDDISTIISPKRVRYLSEITECIQKYHSWVEKQCEIADKIDQLTGSIKLVADYMPENHKDLLSQLEKMRTYWQKKLETSNTKILDRWDETAKLYSSKFLESSVRDKIIKNELYWESLSGTKIPKISLPKYTSSADKLKFALTENLPGYFPFTAGVFPLKRVEEDPARMFAGEGTPERTNKRFHYLSSGITAKRLSTAFDSVTLYGEDPDTRPDIYGKIGNSGVSVCSLDDAKKLYSGFRLSSPSTSVSMTINGPAPMLLAMFMNTVIDQEIEYWLKERGEWDTAKQKINSIFKKLDITVPEYHGVIPVGHDGTGLGLLGVTGDALVDKDVYENIKNTALSTVRGTVQADILKEDQAQNTCIFSTEFALRMMGDVQSYFTKNNVRNYYSVSISGYHIAEAGANPITQVAFTLANGFTYVEYYLSRGLNIDDFAHNLSFFFSNGLDPEYAVIGRVARRIWAIAMRDKYGASERSQKLKYHIQTSGRSLHAKEINFNDIRTTLQALLAIYDNCNSLHTNAYDEAITTPTEESVRRALAIQLIINKELGLSKNENALQGSFIINELTTLVESAILAEFDRITERGGVLGAMETMYQRGKIQDESLYYETLKHNGSYPVIGVNTFLSESSPSEGVIELIRSTQTEKKQQIENLDRFKKIHAAQAQNALLQLQSKARNSDNLFDELMHTVKYCSLGQITKALYDVGGQYRRNM